MTPAVIFLVSVLEGKRKRTSHSADSSLNSHESSSQFSSSVGSESEWDEKHKHHKHKRHVKSKRSKRKRRESKKERNNTPSKQRSFFKIFYLFMIITLQMYMTTVQSVCPDIKSTDMIHSQL